MRRHLHALLALAASVAAQEEPRPEPSPYAAMGFPVVFDDEIITEHDVARFIGLPLSQIEPLTLERQRDVLIFRKIADRIAASLGIDVPDREVDEVLRREADMRGGDAKFYEWLAQQGLTLERFRLERRQGILDQKLRILFQTGMSHDRQQLLPGRIRPRPCEIETAFRNDPQRRAGAVRVRRLAIPVDADKAVRDSLATRQALGMETEESVKEKLEAHIRPKVDALLAETDARPFAEVARARAIDVEAMEKEWVAVTGSSEADLFLASGAVGSRSGPIPQRGGTYVVLFLIERDNPAERKPSDPGVADEYDKRIRLLRAAKWEALLRRAALDQSTVEPPRVRDAIRSQILDALREASEGLGALGLR